VDEVQIIEIKRERFIKSLFLCLFILSLFSVDRSLQAFIFNMYSDSKVCGHVARRGVDNRSKPVGKSDGYPQVRFSSVFRPCYQPSLRPVIHRA
jgi:hypothetical protein